MKKIILTAVIALGTLVCLGPSVQAAEGEGQGQRQRGERQDQLEVMKKELSLTDKQVEQLKPILEEQRTKMREIMQDTAASREDRRAKMTKLQEATTAKLKPVLTKEQFEKWEKLRQERQQRRQRPQQAQ